MINNNNNNKINSKNNNSINNDINNKNNDKNNNIKLFVISTKYFKKIKVLIFFIQNYFLTKIYIESLSLFKVEKKCFVFFIFIL